jgi:hypothetical protein
MTFLFAWGYRFGVSNQLAVDDDDLLGLEFSLALALRFAEWLTWPMNFEECEIWLAGQQGFSVSLHRHERERTHIATFSSFQDLHKTWPRQQVGFRKRYTATRAQPRRDPIAQTYSLPVRSPLPPLFPDFLIKFDLFHQAILFLIYFIDPIFVWLTRSRVQACCGSRVT